MENLPILDSICWTIASTLYKNCFHYAGVLLTELMNESILSLAKNLSIVSIKLALIVPTMSVPELILCIEKFIDDRKWYGSYERLAKNT